MAAAHVTSPNHSVLKSIPTGAGAEIALGAACVSAAGAHAVSLFDPIEGPDRDLLLARFVCKGLRGERQLIP